MDIKSEALNYVRERYVEEQQRFKHIEDKCAVIVSFLTVSIAAFGSILGLKNTGIFTPNSVLDWLIFTFCILTLFVLACAWGHALLALKLGKCPVAAKSRINADFIFKANENDAFEQIYDCYVSPIETLENVINQKAKNLSLAYNEIVISAWLIALFAILVTLKELL
jgi:hypothetical protein